MHMHTLTLSNNYTYLNAHTFYRTFAHESGQCDDEQVGKATGYANNPSPPHQTPNQRFDLPKPHPRQFPEPMRLPSDPGACSALLEAACHNGHTRLDHLEHL